MPCHFHRFRQEKNLPDYCNRSSHEVAGGTCVMSSRGTSRDNFLTVSEQRAERHLLHWTLETGCVRQRNDVETATPHLHAAQAYHKHIIPRGKHKKTVPCTHESQLARAPRRLRPPPPHHRSSPAPPPLLLVGLAPQRGGPRDGVDAPPSEPCTAPEKHFQQQQRQPPADPAGHPEGPLRPHDRGERRDDSGGEK